MLRIVPLVLALALLPRPAAAFDSPEALFGAIYGPMIGGAGGPGMLPYEAVLSADTRRAMAACMARNEFCIEEGLFTTGQDFNVANVHARRLAMDDRTARYDVSFTNFGSPARMTYSLVRETDGWRVHDVLVAGRSASMRRGVFGVD